VTQALTLVPLPCVALLPLVGQEGLTRLCLRLLHDDPQHLSFPLDGTGPLPEMGYRHGRSPPHVARANSEGYATAKGIYLGSLSWGSVPLEAVRLVMCFA
jgi:hypothetical protein